MIDYTSMTDNELQEHLVAVYAEERRRATIANAEREVVELTDRYQEAVGGADDGADWEQPATSLQAYTEGRVVAHAGKHWMSTHPGLNVWEPGTGTRTWVEVWPNGEGGWATEPPSDPDSPASPIPWAIDQAVRPGDLRTHEGRIWKAKVEHVTHAGWPPSQATHAVWEDMGPA